MKLLAKNAEDRYQSAFGLKSDLERVMSYELGVMSEKQSSDNSSLITHHSSFPLGTRDFSGRFQIPQKLYGREAEVDILLAAFERVATGVINDELGVRSEPLITHRSSFITIAGYSGVGKSALVYEIHKPITARQGYFVSGKFDQFQRNIPYSALTQALNEFCSQLMAETEASLMAWQERILGAVGNNGQVLIEVIPHLEWVIGKQPAVPQVGPKESQNRFNLFFQNFMKAICQLAHPLVMFIDDLQWADLASLELLKQILTNTENHGLLLIGAYRDNEVDAAHPFMLTVGELAKAGVQIHQVHLPNLTRLDVTALVAEALHSDHEAVHELVQLLYEKTQGNAFFVTQFLIALYEQEYLEFNYTRMAWQWDMGQIRALSMSDNVVALMTQKLARLVEATQTGLKLAACIGNKFALSTLAVISEQTPQAALVDLWSAIEEGLLLPLDENYRQIWVNERISENLQLRPLAHSIDNQFKFVHDRVQQAAYSLIAENERAALHLKIGRLWLVDTGEGELEERLFDIVNQLNAGRELMDDVAEKVRLAELNLQAGQCAKQATAYQAAADYFNIATKLLGENAWQVHYELVFALYREHGEAEFLLGHFEASDSLLAMALDKAQTKFDKAEVYLIKLAQLALQAHYREAVALAIEALNMFGLDMPTLDETEKQQQATEAEMALYAENMASRTISDLYHLPLIEDPIMKACAGIMGLALDSLIVGVPELFGFYTTKMVNMSIQYGLSDYTPVSYVFFGYVQLYTDYKVAYGFSALGVKLIEGKLLHSLVRTKVYANHPFPGFVQESIQQGLAYFKQAYRIGLETGDLVHTGYALNGILRYLCPLNLTETLDEVNTTLNFFLQTNNTPMLFFVRLVQGFCRNLQGNTFSVDTLNSSDFSEEEYLKFFKESILTGYYYFYKLQSLTIWGLDDKAWLSIAKHKDSVLVGLTVDMLAFRDYHLFCGLVCVRHYKQTIDKEKAKCLDIFEENLVSLKQLVEDGSEANFNAAYLLLAAEKARLENNALEAMKLYNQAIQGFKAQGFLRDEAVANERAAQFYFAQGLGRVALDYLRQAHYAYQHWGATAKVKQLEAKYPELRGQMRSSFSGQNTITTSTAQSGTSNLGNQILDLASIMKASQTISGEIKLESLLEKMMQIVMENAGAQRGLLILRQDNQWLLQAEIGSDELRVMNDELPNVQNSKLITPNIVKILQAIPVEQIGGLSDNPKLSGAMLRYVERTQQALVIADAPHNSQFAQTAYVQKCQPKSILCVPMINQGAVMGFIYLENNLSTHTFTPERVEIVQLLGTQATISIYNLQTLALQAEQAQLRLRNELLEQLNADKDKFFFHCGP